MHSDDVAEGAIRIGTTDEKGHFKGTDYKKLAFGEPARNISMSLQGGKLSQMTVEEYIRLANPQASEELVNRVKDLVGIKEDKDNPSCISPSLMIDSGGNNVSGGQINRLNLAQALIKDAPIMILDEPTAGVDATMSENIINYINGLKNDKTIVYITHNVDEVKSWRRLRRWILEKTTVRKRQRSSAMTCLKMLKKNPMSNFLPIVMSDVLRADLQPNILT